MAAKLRVALGDANDDDKGNLRPTYAPAGRAVPEKVGKAAKADAEGKGVKAPKASKGW